MAQTEDTGLVTIRELLVSTLAQGDALAKLLIEKGVINLDEYMAKLSIERGVSETI
jgi:hypothetical protein